MNDNDLKVYLNKIVIILDYSDTELLTEDMLDIILFVLNRQNINNIDLYKNSCDTKLLNIILSIPQDMLKYSDSNSDEYNNKLEKIHDKIKFNSKFLIILS